jgi:hypothetical protein
MSWERVPVAQAALRKPYTPRSLALAPRARALQAKNEACVPDLERQGGKPK